MGALLTTKQLNELSYLGMMIKKTKEGIKVQSRAYSEVPRDKEGGEQPLGSGYLSKECASELLA